MKNFTEYWKANEKLFKQAGVTEAIARRIWNDCVDAVELALLREFTKILVK